MKAWVDGELYDTDVARVSIFDHGFTVGDGVFETTKVVDGVAFALTRHLARLERSAERLGLQLPDTAHLREAVAAVLSANATENVGRLRITVTGGAGPLGSDRGASGPTVVVACAVAKDWHASSGLVTVPWPRNERSAVAGVKTTSYAENVVALAWSHDRGGSEALFLNTRGEVCEGTGSNVFLVLEGQLVTPPLGSGCLAGVTRELVVEWCAAEPRVLSIADLEAAEEVFVSSSTRDVHPVHQLDGRTLEAPGPVTKVVMQTFAERAASDLDP